MVAKPFLAFAAFSLAMAGTAASARSAAPLSLAQSPAAARPGAELRGTIMPVLIGVLVIGMLAFIIKELGDDNELPGSP